MCSTGSWLFAYKVESLFFIVNKTGIYHNLVSLHASYFRALANCLKLTVLPKVLPKVAINDGDCWWYLVTVVNIRQRLTLERTVCMAKISIPILDIHSRLHFFFFFWHKIIYSIHTQYSTEAFPARSYKVLHGSIIYPRAMYTSLQLCSRLDKYKIQK